MSASGALAAPRALVDVACALCGSRERRERFRDGPYAVVTCLRCDLTYVTPRLADVDLIAEVYDEGYWRSSAARERGYTDYRADAELYRETYRRRLAVLAPHFARAGRVLDIGCAAGYFLQVMRAEGWDAWGFEPSETIRRSANEALGPERVHGGRLQEAGFGHGSFDLVTLWDVIEHTPDPLATLRAAADLAKPDGKLLIETQNVNSLAARVLGPRWQHYKHAEHLHHFHAGTLSRALGLTGWRVVTQTKRFGGKLVSPRFIVERAKRVHPLLSVLVSPVALLGKRGIYVNPFDELIVVAERIR
ncbi:MAG: class I SAM-dependent methyltransferase [Planctomycetes bacterium]|nr:class I SAM-dependent methyltransferase [Planctomycetota bacterium]